MSKQFEKVSTSELAIFFNKIDALLKDISSALLKMHALENLEGYNNPELNNNRKKLIEKQQDAIKIGNRVALEIEVRAKKKIGFSFDYPMISRISFEVDDHYKKYFHDINEIAKENNLEIVKDETDVVDKQ